MWVVEDLYATPNLELLVNLHHERVDQFSVTWHDADTWS